MGLRLDTTTEGGTIIITTLQMMAKDDGEVAESCKWKQERKFR